MDTRAFVQAADSMQGTPFLHQGRVPGVGLDCAGLVVCALKRVGVDVADQRGYSRIPRNGVFLLAVTSHCHSVPLGEIQTGDLLMFRWRSEPQHIAIYADGDLIHAWQGAGKVVRHIFDQSWRGRLTGCWRIRD